MNEMLNEIETAILENNDMVRTLTNFGDYIRDVKKRLEEAEGREMKLSELVEKCPEVQQFLRWERYERTGDSALDKTGAQPCNIHPILFNHFFIILRSWRDMCNHT